MKKLRILPELRLAAFGRESCAKRVGGENRLLSGTFPFRSPYNPRDLSAPSQRSTGIPVFMDDCLRGTQENFRSYKENQPAPSDAKWVDGDSWGYAEGGRVYNTLLAYGVHDFGPDIRLR